MGNGPNGAHDTEDSESVEDDDEDDKDYVYREYYNKEVSIVKT